MKASIGDRIISVLAYFTFGIFSLIWLVFAYATRKTISQYLIYNLYQAIFVSIVLAVISLIYSIAINFISVIPIVGNIAKSFDLFFNQTPLYYTYTVSGLLVTLIVLYLSVISLLGLKPYLPVISDMVNSNFIR